MVRNNDCTATEFPGIKITYDGPRKDLEGLLQAVAERALTGKTVCHNADVVLKKVAAMEEGAFRLSQCESRFWIESSDMNGFFWGVGELLRKVVTVKSPRIQEGLRIPCKSTRGVYFATHFHNFYHDAPVEEVFQYLEELALWGQNSLMLWFDMHHYNSVKDPLAQDMISRIKQYITHAHLLGMKVTLLMLGNESFNNSPVELRASWEPRGNYTRRLSGHYHIEICPSKPGGLDAILAARKEMLSEFLNAAPDALLIFPYDQGGCTCSDCEPWGVNGFLRVGRGIQKLAREMFPHIKVGLSCWRFDAFIPGESETFHEMLKDSTEFDFIMSYPFFKNGYSDFRVPLLGFPEISMPGAVPWGGFGGNPVPKLIEEEWSLLGCKENGGFPYSEGIFEDMNKISMLALYSGEAATVEEAFRAYIRFYFGEEFENEIWEVVCLMERTLRRHRMDELGKIHDYASSKNPWVGEQRFVISDTQPIEEIYQRIHGLSEKLPKAVSESWRFQLLKYRAIIDHELAAHNFYTCDTTQQCYQQLTRIYHAENADYVVSPPTLEAIRINRGDFE